MTAQNLRRISDSVVVNDADFDKVVKAVLDSLHAIKDLKAMRKNREQSSLFTNEDRQSKLLAMCREEITDTSNHVQKLIQEYSTSE